MLLVSHVAVRTSLLLILFTDGVVCRAAGHGQSESGKDQQPAAQSTTKQPEPSTENLATEDTLPLKARISRIRDLGKRKADAIPALSAYLSDPDREIRREAVRAITRIGGEESLTPLIRASSDGDVDVQTDAIAGLVNYYAPGYVAGGFTAPITRGVRNAKSLVFTHNTQTIDPSVTVRSDVQQAIADVVAHGSSFSSRAAAARAAGILRCHAAVPALGGSLRARDSDLIFECLLALQKIRDRKPVPALGSTVHDLDERIQLLALETVGVLRATSVAPEVRSIVRQNPKTKTMRAALQALAMLGLTDDRPTFQRYLESSDTELRASAIEGLGRIREPEDFPALENAFNEQGADWRIHLAAAFALVNQGKADRSEHGPLSFLVENTEMKTRAQAATAYLAEACRQEEVRRAIVPMIEQSGKDARLAFCSVLGETGDESVLPVLDAMLRDADPDVAVAASRAAKTVRARS